MKKFEFKLEPLLDYRLRLEDILKKDLMEAGRLLEVEEVKLRELTAQHRDSIAEVERVKGEDNNTEELMLYYNYLVGLKTYIKEQDVIVRKSKKVYEAQRMKLVESAKDRRTVELVKEKAFNQHASDAVKEDQKITDDIGTTRYIRGASSEEG